MWRVEARSPNITKRAGPSTAILPSQRITVVLYQPQLIGVTERTHCVDVERVAQRVGEHDGLASGRQSGLQL
jgi:hypothetical protein